MLAAGKIAVARTSLTRPDNKDFAIARYNTDGSPDTTFDEDGKRTDNVSDLEATAKSAAIQTDGKIVIAVTTPAARAPNTLQSCRYNPTARSTIRLTRTEK